MKARNDENLEGIQRLARDLGRLLPGGGARGEAIAELQARAEAAERIANERGQLLATERAKHEAAERERDEWHRTADQLGEEADEAQATFAAVRESAEKVLVKKSIPAISAFGLAKRILAILDREGE